MPGGLTIATKWVFTLGLPNGVAVRSAFGAFIQYTFFTKGTLLTNESTSSLHPFDCWCFHPARGSSCTGNFVQNACRKYYPVTIAGYPHRDLFRANNSDRGSFQLWLRDKRATSWVLILGRFHRDVVDGSIHSLRCYQAYLFWRAY